MANWSHLILSALSVLLLYPFLVSTLGDEQYGVWLLIVSITGYLYLLQVGVPVASVRYLSEHYYKHEYDEYNKVLSTNLVFFTCVSAMVVLFGTGLYFTIDIFFDIPEQYVALAKIAVLLSALEVAIRLLFQIFESAIHANQKFVPLYTVKNSATIFRLVASFTLINSESGLVIIPLILIGTVVYESAFYLYISKYYNPHLKVNLSSADLKVFKNIFGFSMVAMIVHVSSRASFNSDAIVIGSVVSISSIVVFTSANSLIQYLMEFTYGISDTMMPSLTKHYAEKKLDLIRQNYITYTRRVAFLVTPICLSLFFFGSAFISLWLGEEYGNEADMILKLLVIGYIILLPQLGLAMPTLMTLKRMNVPALFFLAMAALNIVISIFLGESHGINGVALGTTIPNILLALFLMYFVSKELDFSLVKYMFQALIQPLLCALFFLAPALGILHYFVVDTYVEVFLFSAICCLAYYFVFYLLLASPEDREFVQGLKAKFSSK